MGNYIFTTLPFGAVNSPYVFLVISEIFPIFIYMDDILIATANVDNEVALIKTFIKNIVELLAWEGGCGAGDGNFACTGTILFLLFLDHCYTTFLINYQNIHLSLLFSDFLLSYLSGFRLHKLIKHPNIIIIY